MQGPEIAWRLKSLIRDQIDSARIPLGMIPTLNPENLPTAAEFTPGLSCTPVSRADWQEPVSERKRAWRRRLVEKAGLILDDRYSYFDLRAVHHENPINWHRDFSAEIDAPVIQSIRIDYRDFRKFGDCKLVWEPNRHHQLVVLGRAYVATGDRKYAVKLSELLRSWIDANPFGYGMNWKSPLEQGVRLINWVWAIDLVRSADVFDDALWNDILQTSYLAMWDCERKFSQGSSANNHLIGEAAGVFVAACYFDELSSTDKWRQSSQAVLEREIIAQTYPDGCTREHAFNYQFFVIQFFQICIRAGEAADHPFSGDYKNQLHSMYRFMDNVSADTGQPPNIGDQDDGYVLDLGDLPCDAGQLLSVGGFEFDDADIISSDDSESVFWLFGDLPQQLKTGKASRPSVLFPDSGYCVLRSKRMSVFFDCAELGYGPIAAHGHADCLSVVLSLDRRPILVDAGTFDYFSHPDWRKYFRETRAHNTAMVDESSQSEILGPFMWGHRARATILEWHDDIAQTTVSGEHDGYCRLDDPLTHRRNLQLDKKNDSLLITDHFLTKSKHRVELFYHLDPTCSMESVGDKSAEFRSGGNTLRLESSAGQLSCVSATDDEKAGWISKGYHHKRRSNCIRIDATISTDSTIVSKFSVLPSMND